MKIILFAILFLCASLFVPINLDAEEEEEEKSIPAMAYLAYKSPYYLSDFDYGIHALNYIEMPLIPYLTEETTVDSSVEEIARAYERATADKALQTIVVNDDRIQYFVVRMTDAPDIIDDTKYYTFSNFVHSDDFRTFTLGSLPSKDKQQFYDTVSRYINAGKAPEPFDATIEFATGDGTILQTWKYSNCEFAKYSIFLKDSIGILNYIKFFGNEIRDETTFECRSILFEPEFTQKSTDLIPPPIPVSNEDRATSFAVHLVDSPENKPHSFYTFSKFEPAWIDDGTAKGAFGKYSVGFALESVPTKDKEFFYEQGIAKYINPGKTPEPFDVDIEVVTGDGSILQTWEYEDCVMKNHTPYLLEFMMVYKFHPDFNSEIRDRTEFVCEGVHFYPEQKNVSDETKQLLEKPLLDEDRAFFYTIRLVDAPDIESPQTSFKFSSFSYITDPTYSRYSGIAPDNPFGSKVAFYIEGLTSKDKQPLYEVVSKYINPGKVPEPFDIEIDHVTADGHVIQTWENEDCQITDYQSFLDDVLVRYKFQRAFLLEVRDTVWFECDGYNLNPELRSPPADYVAPPLVPVEKVDRAQSYIVRLVDASDIDFPKSWYTFGKFLPMKFSKGETTPVGYPIYQPGFGLESLPNYSNEDFYEIVSRYTTTEKDPEPFDVDIESVTGDGYVLQTWKYENCELTEYQPYTNRNLVVIKLHKGSEFEMRDRSIFQCNGLHFDPTLKEPTDETLTKAGTVPTYDERAISYTVNLIDAPDIEFPKRTLTFTEFLPSFDTPQFTLNSLPSNDKKDFYEIVKRYIEPEKDPEPFDVEVEILTGEGNVLQTWKYDDCKITSYTSFNDVDLTFIKYIDKIASEIKDETVFDCDSWHLDPTIITSDDDTALTGEMSPREQMKAGISAEQLTCKDELVLMLNPNNQRGVCVKDSSVEKMTERGWSEYVTEDVSQQPPIHGVVLPEDGERAMKYLVHLTDAPDLDSPKTWKTFSTFAPYSSSELVYSDLSPIPLGVAPGYTFGEKPKFFLESLPSKDKLDFYEIVSMYINPGKEPEPFDMRIDVLTGNDELLQSWDYDDCQMETFSLFLNEQILTFKYHEKYTAEYQDRTLFECEGFSFNDDSETI